MTKFIKKFKIQKTNKNKLINCKMKLIILKNNRKQLLKKRNLKKIMMKLLKINNNKQL